MGFALPKSYYIYINDVPQSFFSSRRAAHGRRRGGLRAVVVVVVEGGEGKEGPLIVRGGKGKGFGVRIKSA